MNSKETMGDSQAFHMMHPDFDSLVQRIVQGVAKDQLAELRKDFHNRLRITLTHPESSELIEDLWDFFYDWCVFEQHLPEQLDRMSEDERKQWEEIRKDSQRGLYTVAKVSDDGLKLKELFTGKAFEVARKGTSDFLGISRGDIIEVRLIGTGDSKEYSFVRRPSFHPNEVHAYIKTKVKQFKKGKDFATYQNWLWLLVGMYLKHRIYQHMPIEKIYDDNSRI